MEKGETFLKLTIFPERALTCEEVRGWIEDSVHDLGSISALIERIDEDELVESLATWDSETCHAVYRTIAFLKRAIKEAVDNSDTARP